MMIKEFKFPKFSVTINVLSNLKFVMMGEVKSHEESSITAIPFQHIDQS
jgi:hypothetical protein